mmetsp:Transcript_13021/g.14330  ORF Transcript_13021/g.14330 Transcript_13021/m.14330 type:complete len:86 (-) Transcript_13021:192-449(-)
MQLYTRTPFDKTITIDVGTDTTILEIKILFARKISGMALPKLVVFAGKLLQDDRTVDDYNLSHECSVSVFTEFDFPIRRQDAYGK